MKEQVLHTRSVAWVVELRTILEANDFIMSPDQTILLEKVFRQYQVHSPAKINLHLGMIIPVIARNADEQRRLQALLVLYYPPNADARKPDTSIYKGKRTFASRWKAYQWLHKNRIRLGMAAGLLALMLAIGLLFSPRPPIVRPPKTNDQPQDSLSQTDNRKDIQRAKCFVTVGFSYKRDPTNDLRIRFKNHSWASGKCIQMYIWDFGDRGIARTNSADETVVHEYKSPGKYQVSLDVMDSAGLISTITQDIYAGVDISPYLPDARPRKTYPAFVNSGIKIPLLLAIGMFIVVMLSLLIHVGDRLYQYWIDKRIGRSFRIRASQEGGVHYTFKDQTGAIHTDGINAVNSGQPANLTSDNSLVLDIPTTIDQTIRHYGFPSIHFQPGQKEAGYLILIDAGQATGQQQELFDWVCDRWLPRHLPCVRLYYHHNFQYISIAKNGKDMYAPSLLSVYYKDHKLLVFGDGYGLLPTFDKRQAAGAPGHVQRSAATFLNNWEHKMLFTPVPRSYWSTYEKELLQLIPLQPATWRGLQQGWRYINGREKYQVPADTEKLPYVNGYPVQADLQAYESLFQQDVQLLIWLCTLAVPDRLELNLTLAIGQALENEVFTEGAPLVTYDNLLRLTSIGFVQTGLLTTAHKTTLIQTLQTLPQGRQALQAAARATLTLYQEVEVTGGSLLSIDKKINEVILTQWASDESQYEIGFLHKHQLLDNFHEKAFGPVIKDLQRTWITRHLSRVIWAGLAVTGLLAFVMNISLVVNNYLDKNVPRAWIEDRFSMYVNMACDTINAEATYRDSLTSFRYQHFNEAGALQLLDLAEQINDTNRMVTYNRNVAEYKVALSLYDRKLYSSALQKFTNILSRDMGLIRGGDDSIKVFAELGQLKCYYFLGEKDYFLTSVSYLKDQQKWKLNDLHLNYDSLIYKAKKNR